MTRPYRPFESAGLSIHKTKKKKKTKKKETLLIKKTNQNLETPKKSQSQLDIRILDESIPVLFALSLPVDPQRPPGLLQPRGRLLL